jgi:DNA transposition AAA+ family ATPase
MPETPERDQQQKDLREAMDRLNESNRILLESMMLSKDKPLTVQQHFAVIDRFQKYIADRGIKPAQVAREIGYSAGVVSQWASNTYKGDLDAVTHAINDWLERDARRAQAKRPKDYVSTWVAETMRTIAYQADKRIMIAAIVAPAGSGKSKVLKALTEEMRGLYLYCTEAMTAREFLISLSVHLGFKDETFRSKASLLRFVVNRLQGTKRIIFLDEAHQLSKAIGCIRAIHDQAGVPIVMAGTAEILNMVDDRADGRGQFSSRCIRFNVCEAVRDAQDPRGGSAGRDLFTIEEIKAFFQMKRIRLTTDALRLMWLLACLPNHGTLRLVETLAEIALDLNAGVEVLDRSHIIEALEMFRGRKESDFLQTLTERHERLIADAKVA